MGTRGALAAAGAVAAVGVAIGWRASRCQRGQVSADRGLETDPLLVDDLDPDRFVASLIDAIAFETVVADDGTYDVDAFDALDEMLVRRYPRAHDRMTLERFNEHGLLYVWEGSDPLLDPLVLMAHRDVVPVAGDTTDEWLSPPFGGAEVDGRIYGRGALDCKGPLIAIFEAIEYVCAIGITPERSVLLVSGHDEEIGGSRGSHVIAEALAQRGVTPWFVVDEGGWVTDGLIDMVSAPVALVGIAEKGAMNVKMTVRAEGGHASVPPSDAAIVQLAEAVSKLEASSMPAHVGAVSPLIRALSKHLPGVVGALASNRFVVASLLPRLLAGDAEMDALQRTTMVPTIIEGGMKTNVLPSSASVILNIRIIPGDSSRSVVDHIRRVVGDHVEIEVLDGFKAEPSVFASTESDAWAALTGVIEEVFPLAIIAPYVVPGGTDARYFCHFSGDVYRFSPFVVDAEALGGYHGTNEFVRSADARSAVSFFVRLISVAAMPGGSSG